MKKIYIVLTYTGTILSKIIKLYTKKEYSHVSKDNYFYCAEFLKFILDESGININLPEIIKPEDFENVKNKNILYKGYLKNYNYRLSKLYENQVAC